MNAKEFFDKVVEMRAAQKRFFRTRITSDMHDAKKLEKEIDMEIERVRSILTAR